MARHHGPQSQHGFALQTVFQNRRPDNGVCATNCAPRTAGPGSGLRSERDLQPALSFFPSHLLADDKLHDHCGVFAVSGHAEAAKLTYLGLYALQHRGQESAGIAVAQGERLVCHKGMGHVDEVFTPAVLKNLEGELAIGHTRYSTAGDTDLRNAQPLTVSCQKGQVALAHNGNLVNASAVRRELEARGDIFQTSSDTEVILHFFARSKHAGIPESLADALDRVEGAYSLWWPCSRTASSAYAIRAASVPFVWESCRTPTFSRPKLVPLT